MCCLKVYAEKSGPTSNTTQLLPSLRLWQLGGVRDGSHSASKTIATQHFKMFTPKKVLLISSVCFERLFQNKATSQELTRRTAAEEAEVVHFVKRVRAP